jgi:uncharacterized protein
VSAAELAIADVLREIGPAVVAVSGGVDSMTLAHLAALHVTAGALMVHAVSPAVPAAATARVREHARNHAWQLAVLDAREFADPRYRANPVDRCYFCKSRLYDRIRGLFHGTIASGTNLDDLGDFRPGLKAAEERRVVHPFVEAGICKAGIRQLVRWHSLTDIAELPAQPCLASRVETGIRIDADDLAFVDAAERHIRRHVSATANVRCRLTRQGGVVELGGEGVCDPGEVAELAASFCKAAWRAFVGVRPYRRGSAFIRTSGQSDDIGERN